ncbi:hypothetical protein J8F10_13405 [Gemmata sp. G18]|uniref:Uncharacterized protein n=1 Tax=Gemmata palustris TaxID=2822762 RepID=A0ABS5BRE3_9BACT|nr:hypothetical protein [Gemmata palustris]MBP3956281.1 hypothetical protein [Gemmata palustris]
MRSVVFRSLGLLVGVPMLLVAVMVAREGRYQDAVLMGGLGALFTIYGALGEYKMLQFFGVEHESPQKSGRGKFGE